VEPLNTRHGDDSVSEMLRTLHIRTTVFCRSDMHAPWGFAVKAHGRAAFHILLEGACWLEVDGADEAVRLEAGDVVVLPRGPGHRLRSEKSARVEWLDDILERTPPVEGKLVYGGRGAPTDLVCGVFEIEEQEALPVLNSIPSIALVRASEGRSTWLGPLLELVKAEVVSFEPGADSVVARLADVLLLQVVRGSLQASNGYVFDSQVGTAMRLMREEPERAWTVDSLAHTVAASRTSLADRFRQATGMPLMRYLTRLRIAFAARQLSGTNASLAEIAARVGYSSDAALSKAFLREMGSSPRNYRLAARSRTVKARSVKSGRRRRTAA
jgi:AraC-like DNA-binding protein/mannose-6-phosphate isomerase-like protein (cupin superfamily)